MSKMSKMSKTSKMSKMSKTSKMSKMSKTSKTSKMSIAFWKKAKLQACVGPVENKNKKVMKSFRFPELKGSKEE